MMLLVLMYDMQLKEAPRDKTTNKEIAKATYRTGKWYWIGITDRSIQGSYKYSSDNGTLTTSRWGNDRPSNDAKDCGVMCNSNGYWCDESCSTTKYYVCEGTSHENQIEALKTKVSENSEEIENIIHS